MGSFQSTWRSRVIEHMVVQGTYVRTRHTAHSRTRSYKVGDLKMAAQDKEGVWRGSCVNHPPHRFGLCVVFVSQEGTSKCMTCGCVHVGIRHLLSYT